MESNLSDFSDEGEQMDKENCRQPRAASDREVDEQQRRIFEQQQLQRQQFYSQQQQQLEQQQQQHSLRSPASPASPLSNGVGHDSPEHSQPSPMQVDPARSPSPPPPSPPPQQLVPAAVKSDGDDEEPEPALGTPEPVPDCLVERIDQEHWPGVNGDYDNDGEWREWHEMTTAVNVYSGDIVNILPYVNISC